MVKGWGACGWIYLGWHRIWIWLLTGPPGTQPLCLVWREPFISYVTMRGNAYILEVEESQLMEFYICKPKPGQKEVQIICNERGHPTFSVSLFTQWSRAGMGWITTVTVIFLELWFCVSSWYFLEVESVALFLHCKHFHVSQAPHLHHCTCMYANCISIEIIWKLTRDSLWWWWWCVEASNHVSTDQQLRAETPISSLFLPSSQLLIIPWFFFYWSATVACLRKVRIVSCYLQWFFLQLHCDFHCLYLVES